MFNKKLLLLLGGYIVGNVINSIYNNTKGKDLRKEMKHARKSGVDSKRLVIDNFIDTHKNILESFKKDILTKENIALFKEKKKEAMKVVEEYKKSGEELLEDLKGKGSEFIDSTKEEITEMYEEKKSDFKKAKIQAPKKLKKIKDKLIAKVEDK